MNALMVSPSLQADDEILCFLNETNLVKDTAIICKSVSQTLCNLYNMGLEQNGMSSQNLSGKSLTLKISFEMPTVDDFLDPSVDVMVQEV